MDRLEKEIERDLGNMVKRHGGLCLKWICPGWDGVPDRLVLLPGGIALFVETKRPKGGKRSALQKWWAKKLQGLGFPHFWVKDRAGIDALEAFLEEVLI